MKRGGKMYLPVKREKYKKSEKEREENECDA